MATHFWEFVAESYKAQRSKSRTPFGWGLCIIGVFIVLSTIHVWQGRSILGTVGTLGTVLQVTSQNTLSTVVICSSEDFKYLPRMFDSVRRQTVQADQTLFVLSLDGSEEALQKVLPLFREHPEYELEVRKGTYYAGQNRDHGFTVARGAIVTFFDCDDLMHPQRNEVIIKMFKLHPDLNSMVHGIIVTKNLDGKEDQIYRKFRSIDMTNKALFEKPWDYGVVYGSPIFTNWSARPWNVSDMHSEPNRNHKRWWGWPQGVTLSPSPQPGPNGHLSLCKSAVEDVPFAYTPRAQDALYHWRLPKNRNNHTQFRNFPLTAYRENTDPHLNWKPQ
eukprot:GHVU01178876.1.p1 GENE.GHVU01178876.1~~GHVU01178876.1.p1  ORF type:complete len:332 (+),score=16.87 GHVU01178876.1:146-1141(+)